MLKKTWSLLLLLSAIITPFSFAAVIYVPVDQPTIQAGIDAAEVGDTVLVADGIYTGDGNRDIDPNGKAVLVISENGSDNCIIDIQGSSASNHIGFYIHNGEDENFLIRGFQIINGYSSGFGGGIDIVSSAPRIQECIFRDNFASSRGGGLSCRQSGSVIEVSNCLFENNQTSSTGGAIFLYYSSASISDCIVSENSAFNGAGIVCDEGSLSISKCIILSNISEHYGCVVCDNSSFSLSDSLIINNIGSYGGGVISIGSNDTVRISDCVFSGNVSDDMGGGFGCVYSSVELFNCLFEANYCDQGGGVAIGESTLTQLVNCTFVNNESEQGEALIFSNIDTSRLTNCIVWGNDMFFYSQPTISYSNIQNGFSGVGNIDLDPEFIIGPKGNFYLSQIAAGQLLDSPCVNAGSDLSYNVCIEDLCMDEMSTRTDEVNDMLQVDMGFHYSDILPTLPPVLTPTPTPTRTPTRTPTPPIDCTSTGVTIWMPSHEFHPGDICALKVTVCNTLGHNLFNFPLFVILGVYGTYFFAPSFTNFDNYLEDYPKFNIGPTEVTVIPEFIWPENAGNASGIVVYGALTDPEITQVFGEMDTWIFGWAN